MSESVSSLPAYETATVPAYHALYPLTTPTSRAGIAPKRCDSQHVVLAVYNSCSYGSRASYSVLNSNAGTLVYHIDAAPDHAETGPAHCTLRVLDAQSPKLPLVELVDLSRQSGQSEEVFLEAEKDSRCADGNTKRWTFRTEHGEKWAIFQYESAPRLPKLVKNCLGIYDRCLSICRVGVDGRTSPPVGQYTVSHLQSPGSLNGKMVLDAHCTDPTEQARFLVSVVAVLGLIK